MAERGGSKIWDQIEGSGAGRVSCTFHARKRPTMGVKKAGKARNPFSLNTAGRDAKLEAIRG